MLHPYFCSGKPPDDDPDDPLDDYRDIVLDDDPDGKTIDGWTKHNKPWVVCSPMGEIDNEDTLAKWFDTLEEAEAWKAQMEVERPAQYYIAHRTEFIANY